VELGPAGKLLARGGGGGSTGDPTTVSLQPDGKKCKRRELSGSRRSA